MTARITHGGGQFLPYPRRPLPRRTPRLRRLPADVCRREAMATSWIRDPRPLARRAAVALAGGGLAARLRNGGVARSATDPLLLELCRLRIGQMLGLIRPRARSRRPPSRRASTTRGSRTCRAGPRARALRWRARARGARVRGAVVLDPSGMTDDDCAVPGARSASRAVRRSPWGSRCPRRCCGSSSRSASRTRPGTDRCASRRPQARRPSSTTGQLFAAFSRFSTARCGPRACSTSRPRKWRGCATRASRDAESAATSASRARARRRSRRGPRRTDRRRACGERSSRALSRRRCASWTCCSVPRTGRDRRGTFADQLQQTFSVPELVELALTTAIAQGFSKAAVAWGPAPTSR